MSESDETHHLIRLKRYENPPSEFVEEFVRNFQDRQRSELLRQSARSLLWERITAYYEELTTPKWGWGFACAGLVAVSSVAYMLRPGAQSTALAVNQATAAEVAQPQETYIVRAIEVVPSANTPGAMAIDARNLIARHYDNGFTDQGGGAALLQAGIALNDDARLYPR